MLQVKSAATQVTVANRLILALHILRTQSLAISSIFENSTLTAGLLCNSTAGLKP
jgi:hypothetical protein